MLQVLNKLACRFTVCRQPEEEEQDEGGGGLSHVSLLLHCSGDGRRKRGAHVQFYSCHKGQKVFNMGRLCTFCVWSMNHSGDTKMNEGKENKISDVLLLLSGFSLSRESVLRSNTCMDWHEMRFGHSGSLIK